MKLKPLFDRVVIEIEEEKNETNGLVMPSTSQERPLVGKIVAVGSGVDFDNNQIGMFVEVGDRVLYNRYCGAEYKIEEKNYLILRQIDIIALLDD